MIDALTKGFYNDLYRISHKDAEKKMERSNSRRSRAHRLDLVLNAEPVRARTHDKATDAVPDTGAAV